MIHNEATTEEVVRMTYHTPPYTYGYKLAAADTLARLHPDVLRALRLPSGGQLDLKAGAGAGWTSNR
jgi:hypothetical protein